ncbi:MAG: cytochrome c3 family protein [Thermodesulfobacteriota bacterium]
MGGKNRVCFKGFCVLVLVLLAAALAAETSESEKDASDKGADMITLRGGAPGDVPFPHGLHQQSLQDCKVCHDSYPEKKDAIIDRQKAGELKKQQVMNNQCIKCHVARQDESRASGPTKCQSCHRR